MGNTHKDRTVRKRESRGLQKWNCYYTVSGSVGVIKYWIHDGMNEPPKEIADYIVKHIFTAFKSHKTVKKVS